MKSINLDEILPLYLWEDDFLICKNTDITALFEVNLPEVWTLSADEYESQYNCWVRALKIMPDYGILHKQDIFVEKEYAPKDTPSGYLGRAYAKHFSGRKYFEHKCYLYVTLSNKENIKKALFLPCAEVD